MLPMKRVLMMFDLTVASLRPIEDRDLPHLRAYKNDPEVGALLGGVAHGYSTAGMTQWLALHSSRSDELLWAIADPQDDRCLGHAGFYRLDHRAGSGEYAIMIGDKSAWGRGIGTAVTRFCVEYAFAVLNLHRVELQVLAANDRAVRTYARIGFVQEGRLREAQYKGNRYHDVVVMGLLRRDLAGFEYAHLLGVAV